ncbi:MAG: hypothetical protein COU47_02400 [Candidatus Niyogibacteria bacterium CG10_big_fil_rev_8_21_14_0_10_46_36]|uniref:Uncharacterized protein n=1 Tax=Candidatus Niyogibacteria bacterium CG10_big_fil_rev_8_21_14_0_10_46_36 TaxID=1974726 RepID=A0A2H0TDG0_9BACT|nr:MAG: hypothetical protein COU47_02400 [Candidatus Niyogibacteria bacterium CG10_big_fil_rev_8_21_14_0_10_46_36]
MNITPEEIQKRFKALPEALREAIFSAEISETLLAIGKKYNLPLDKVGELSTETSLVMLGVTHPNQYISNLQKVLGVERDIARNIAQEVNAQIFAKIRSELKTLHKITENEDAPEKAAASKPPAMEPARAPEPEKTSPPSSIKPFGHWDLPPVPPPAKKTYTFSELQKKQEEQKQTPPPSTTLSEKQPAVPSVLKKPSEQSLSKPPMPSQMPKTHIEEPRDEPAILQKPEEHTPKAPSPFEAKIQDPVFHQQPSEVTKDGKKDASPNTTTKPSAHDPYREPILPEEASFNINPHIKKDE